jgi:hypothetical protein
VGAVRAALLLRFHHLTAVRVSGSAVVGPVVEVDGDIDGFLRDERVDLATDRQGQGSLGPPKSEMAEQPSRGAIGMSPSALGTGAMDGGAEHGGAEEEVRGVAHRGRVDGPAKGVFQEREQPREGLGADLAIGERSGPPSSAAGR